MSVLCSFWILGHVVSMKNSRRMIPGRGARRPMVIKSQSALEYERIFQAQVPRNAKAQFGQHISAVFVVWYSSRLSDLDVELIKDLLQKSGVILNDRQIVEQFCFKRFDKDRPRLFVQLSSVDYNERDSKLPACVSV